MTACQAEFPVRTLCRVLELSPSGYYAWRDRAPSTQRNANAALKESIRTLHAAWDFTYGMPRIREDVREEGIVASRRRTARLMRCAHLRGASRRRGFVVTTMRDETQEDGHTPDLVPYKFAAVGPKQLWVADMTYIPT